MPAASTGKPQDHREAHALVQRSGIPFPAALRVVRGEATLDQVLKKLLTQQVRQGLEARGLPPQLAGQVATGHLPEAKAWEAFRAMKHGAYGADRSLLAEACATRQELVLELFGGGTLFAVPQQVDKYTFVTLPTGSAEERTLLKHEVKWLALAGAAAVIAACRSRDAAVAALGLKASQQMQDRLRLERSAKLDLLDAGRRLRGVTRDGDVLAGQLVWASRYELGLRLEDGAGRSAEVSLFLHALLQLVDAQSAEPIVTRDDRGDAGGGAKGKPQRSAQPPQGRSRPGKKAHARRGRHR